MDAIYQLFLIYIIMILFQCVIDSVFFIQLVFFEEG